MSVAETTAQTDTDEFWLFGYGQDHRGTPEAPGRVVTLISRSYWEQLTDHHDSAPDKVWGVAYRITPDRVAEVKEYLDIREINGYTIHYTPFHPAPDDSVNTALLPSTSPQRQQQRQQQQGHEHEEHKGQTAPINTLVYIGTPENDQFTGPQDPQALAEHIYRSSGPSGANRDYLWGLERALAELSPASGDAHVSDLSERVRAIAVREEEAKKEAKELARERERVGVRGEEEEVAGEEEKGVLQREARHHEQRHKFRRAGSVDEQEETEKTS